MSGPAQAQGASRDPGGRLSWLRTPIAIGVLALAAVGCAAAALALAGDQQRHNLAAPSIAVDGRGLATVAWTEVAGGGTRVAQERAPGRWSAPVLLDPSGGPGSVAVGRDRLAHVAYVGERGLQVADQIRRGSPAPSFRRRVIDPAGEGEPSIALTPSGRAAVLYEGAEGGLRVAVRGRSGAWRILSTPISAGDPQITASLRDLVLAGLEEYGVGVLRVRPSGLGGADGFRPRESVVLADPPPAFDLTSAGPASLVAFVQHQGQLVMLARTGPGAVPVPVAASAGIGSFVSASGLSGGRDVVLFRDPRFRLLTLAVLRGESHIGDLAVGQGQAGDVAIEAGGERADVAYWDPGGRQLLAARIGLNRRLSPFEALPARAAVSAVSDPQETLPLDGKAAIWLAALALLLTIAAGFLLVLERRPGIRLLPFAVVLLILAGFAIRGAYLAEVGIYGLPPNDLLTLDRDAVTAVVDALLILSGAVAILCAIGRLLPAGWRGAVLERTASIGLPSRRGATVVLTAFLLASLVVGAYLLRSDGIDALLKSRQTAFASRGYQLVMLSAGAGAWLVYFAVRGWPDRWRDRLVLAALGAAALVPLLISGARSVAILGFVVPIVLLIHLRVHPLRLRTVLIGLLCLVVFAVGVRQLARGGTTSGYLDAATPTAEMDGGAVRALRPVLGWTEAAGLDAFVLVRTEYVPQFGTDPLLTPGAFASIAVPRSLWPDKPRSAMDTFAGNLNPWNYALSKVGQTTTLAGELTMNLGLAGVFVGFAVFAVLLCLLGELLAGGAGVLGMLVSVALLPRVAAAVWGDSFNAGWGGIVLAVMIVLAVLGGLLVDRRSGAQASSEE